MALILGIDRRHNAVRGTLAAMLMLSLGSPLAAESIAPLAQLAEQLTLNQWVPGSSPGGCTKMLGQRAVSGFDQQAISRLVMTPVRRVLFALFRHGVGYFVQAVGQ